MSFAKIRPRRGTALQWETANPILVEGEIGIEVPNEGVGTGEVKIKFGDGVKTWTDLPYAVKPLEVVDNLLSESTELPLSAKQGKLLQGEIDTLIMKKSYTYTMKASSTSDTDWRITITQNGYTPIAFSIWHNYSLSASAGVEVFNNTTIRGFYRNPVAENITLNVNVIYMKNS